MNQAKEKEPKEKEVDISKPDTVLRNIAFNHLKNEYGDVEIYKKGYLKFWKYRGHIYNPYVDPNAHTIVFITGISKNVIENTMAENAHFMAVNYYGGYGPQFLIYYIQPEILWKYYVKAKVDPRANHKDTWHITINNDKGYIILTRRNTDDVVVPVDDNNYFTRYTMTEEEYNLLLSVLPKKKKPSGPQQNTLKVFVQGTQGYETFSSLSARAIGILSTITKSKKYIDVHSIYSALRDYEIVLDSPQKVQYVIDKLVKIGALEVKNQNLYRLANNIKADIILGS